MAKSTPIQRHRAKPQSKRAAVDAKCWACQGGDETWEQRVVDAIRNCEAKLCYLHPVRPYGDGRRHLPVLPGRASGRRNPMEELSDGVKKPHLGPAIKAQCYSCVAESDRGLRKTTVSEVRACTSQTCALHPVRGYR